MLTIQFQSTCGTINVTNPASNGYDVDAKLYKMDDDLNFVLEEERTILPDETSVYVLEDGEYYLEEHSDPPVNGALNTYKLPIYCTLNACIRDQAFEILCGELGDCDCEKVAGENPTQRYIFESITIVAYMYFSVLNKLMTDNGLATAVTMTDLQDFRNLKMIREKITLYCNNDC